MIFRLGRLVGARDPEITYIIPFVEKMMRVELRTVTMDLPRQVVITRDNVSIKVSAVLYFRVIDPNRAITEVQNYLFAHFSARPGHTQEYLWAGPNGRALSREGKGSTREFRRSWTPQTEPWGIKVVLVAVKDIDLPQEM